MVLLAGKLLSSFLLSNFVFLGNCFQAARAPPRVQVKKQIFDSPGLVMTVPVSVVVPF